MTKLTQTLALALTLAVAAPLAQASDYETYGRIDDATRAQITEKLQAEGYELRQIKMDDGMIEVYALKAGGRYELYLDKAFNVLKTKMDD